MRLPVINSDGEQQIIVVNGQAEVTDRTATLEVDTPTDLIPANVDRGGYFLQNLGSVPLLVCELDADATEENSFQIAPLGTWPPQNYPITIARISVRSGEAALVIAREW